MGISVEDRFSLQDVMLNYAAGVDDRDLALYRRCFCDDVEVVGFGEETINGGDAWTAYVENALQQFGPTQHMLGPMRVTMRGELAECRSDVQAWHTMADAPETTFTLWATYVSTMRRESDGWRICRHELISRGTRRQGATE